MIATILNTTEYGANASELLTNSTVVTTTYASDTITSSAFDISDGLSNVRIDFTLSLTYLPNEPTSLSCTEGINPLRVDCTWTVSSNLGNGTHSGHRIYRETPVGNGFSTFVNDTGSTITSYTDLGVISETTYNYQICSWNEVGCGDRSVADSATTATGSGGGGGTGGGGTGGLTIPIGNAIDLDIFSFPKVISLGETKTFEFDITWDTDETIRVYEIMPILTGLDGIMISPIKVNGDFVSRNNPLILTPDDNTISFTMSVPETECEAGKAISTSRCVSFRTYVILFEILALNENNITSGITAKVEITVSSTVIDSGSIIVLLVAIGAGIGIFNVVRKKKIKNRHSSNNKRKAVRKSLGK